MTDLAKKIGLTQAIQSMRQLFPSEYSFYPQSWILPAQINEFKAYCDQKKGDQNQTGTDQNQSPLCFIIKPDEGKE